MNGSLLNFCWITLLTLATVIVSGYQIHRVTKAWRDVRDEPVPPEVREKSHAVKNEASVVQAGLKQVAKMEDPLGELAARLKKAKWR